MSDARAIEGLEPLDERQTLDERGLDFQAYWQRREQDMRAQRMFWRRFNDRFQGGQSWPFASKK